MPNADPLFGHVKKLEDVPPHFLREVEHFFGTYKQLEGAHTESLGWTAHEEAHAGGARLGRPVPGVAGHVDF